MKLTIFFISKPRQDYTEALTGSEKATVQKMKFSIKDFFSKCDQIRRKLRIWSHLLKKFLMENFVFCAVSIKNKSNVTSKVFTNFANVRVYEQIKALA